MRVRRQSKDNPRLDAWQCRNTSIVDPSAKCTACPPAHDGSHNIFTSYNLVQEWLLAAHGLADIIRSLPQQCCNLELDTQGKDRVESGCNHLCEAIRDAIPGLQRLRLRLGTLCEALFSAESAPILESVSVNCVYAGPSLSGTQLCSPLNRALGPLSQANRTEAAATIAQSLRALTLRCPRLTLATVLDKISNDYDDRTTHPCYNFRDAIANRTHVSPLFNVWALEDGNTLLRSTDEQELMGSRAAIQSFAEGQPWKETANGLRLPAMLFAGEEPAYTSNELHLLTVEAWRQLNPRRSCSLWSNERKTGLRLVEASILDGLIERPIIREATPDGWVRYESEMSDLHSASQ
jgi:hypothetical protein